MVGRRRPTRPLLHAGDSVLDQVAGDESSTPDGLRVDRTPTRRRQKRAGVTSASQRIDLPGEIGSGRSLAEGLLGGAQRPGGFGFFSAEVEDAPA